MRVHVLFFGPVAEALGLREHWLELPSGARIADCLDECQRRWPALSAWRSRLHLSRNLESAAEDSPLAEADEIGLLPPVSGGA